MDNKYLTNIFEGIQDGSAIDEILALAESISPLVPLRLIEEVHHDLAAFFSGAHPDYQQNSLPYHNLRHTRMVALAAIRLFHGLHCNGTPISADMLRKGLLAAYFHDTGMLLEEGDPADSGTQYIAGHEARSILFLRNYVADKGLGDDIARDCAIIINYTQLNSDPATFDWHTHEVQLAGQVVGSADILAQMADRYYLECLPLLYHEQKAGGINSHRSALELMEHTAYFYENVALKRLVTTFSNTSTAMRTHFRVRHNIDRNLYVENIDKNIAYLRKIIAQCKDIAGLDQHLKRQPPIT